MSDSGPQALSNKVSQKYTVLQIGVRMVENQKFNDNSAKHCPWPNLWS